MTRASKISLIPDIKRVFPSERLIVFGSYTPGKLDRDSFKGIGNYGIYMDNDVQLKYADRKRITSTTT